MTEAEMYKKMYAIVCKANSDAMDLMMKWKYREAYMILKLGLSEAEDVYIDATEDAE